MNEQADCTSGEGGSREPTIPILLTTAEVQAKLRCSDRTIRPWVSREYLEPVRNGRTLRFRADDLHRLVSDRLTNAVLMHVGRRKATAKARPCCHLMRKVNLRGSCWVAG